MKVSSGMYWWLCCSYLDVAHLSLNGADDGVLFLVIVMGRRNMTQGAKSRQSGGVVSVGVGAVLFVTPSCLASHVFFPIHKKLLQCFVSVNWLLRNIQKARTCTYLL